MYPHKLTLSITLGFTFTIGLLLALSLYAAPAQAQPALGPAAPTIDHSDAISQALAYIGTQQQPDGGIDAFGFGSGSDEGGTARTVLAVAATGRSVGWMAHITTGNTMMDYLAAQAITYTHDPSGTTSVHLFPEQAGLLLTAVAAANEDPTNFGGMDLIAQLNDTYHPETGAYSTTAQGAYVSGAASERNQTWAILGLVAAGQSVPVTATDYLIGLQTPGGSLYFGDPDVTAMAVVALIGSGNVSPTDPAIQKALDFFRDTQLPSGGWRPSWDTDPANADSTGWVIQALVAVGYTPATASWANPTNPHETLLNLQQADGRIGGTYANAYSTAEALYGLTEQPLYFLQRTHRAHRALTWMDEQQGADGSWPLLESPDAGSTCDAVLAYAAAGFDPYTVRTSGVSAMDYLSATASSFVTKTADSAGKLALAVASAGGDAHDFGSENIVGVLTDTWYSPTLGAFGVPTNTYHQAFAILGLAAAGEEAAVPISATQTLADLQQPNGGWSYDLGGVWISPDHTGLALQALIAAGVPSTHTTIVSGVAYLRSQQDPHGGWGNANSTAYAIQGLLAAGEDLETGWLYNGRSPYEALVFDQKIDGPFSSTWFGTADNDFATWQAVPALFGQYYPLPPAALSPFIGVNRGPDPDRLVAAPLRATWGNSVDVVIPFGSDLDKDGLVSLEWRAVDETTWVTHTMVYRADGYFTATLPVTEVVPYEFQVTFEDPDGVQYGRQTSGTAVLPPTTLEPYYIYLPLVLRQ
jgi:hypothetical protein